MQRYDTTNGSPQTNRETASDVIKTVFTNKLCTKLNIGSYPTAPQVPFFQSNPNLNESITMQK